jgi:hypothetical protein
VFARAFLAALEENDGVIDGQECSAACAAHHRQRAATPEYGEIRGAGRRQISSSCAVERDDR